MYVPVEPRLSDEYIIGWYIMSPTILFLFHSIIYFENYYFHIFSNHSLFGNHLGTETPDMAGSQHGHDKLFIFILLDTF